MKILRFNDLPSNIPNESKVSIDTNEVTLFTHGFHKYPGKFIPQIPRWAIETYINEKTQKILDPFVGSGTSIVEATLLGYDSYGIDIDPLSCLITKVKSTPVNSENFSVVRKWLIMSLEHTLPIFIPKTENISHWFTEDAILKLSTIRTLINQIPDRFSSFDDVDDLFDAFIIAFSGIIRRVSNADNQSQKTYVSGTRPKKPAEVYSLFNKQLMLFEDGLDKLYKIWNKKAKASIIHSSGDADLSILLPEEVDLIVTSPPYIKSIDYVYNQMVELFWVGDLFDMDTQLKQNIKRKKYTGSTLIYKKQYGGFDLNENQLNIPLLNDTLSDILLDKKNGEKHAYIVYKYFKFMLEHFKSANNVLKNGGTYVMAVGNSAVSNINVDTAAILIEIANENGLHLETRWKYIIKNHFMGFDRKDKGGKINIDHVLVFKNRSVTI